MSGRRSASSASWLAVQVYLSVVHLGHLAGNHQATQQHQNQQRHGLLRSGLVVLARCVSWAARREQSRVVRRLAPEQLRLPGVSAVTASTCMGPLKAALGWPRAADCGAARSGASAGSSPTCQQVRSARAATRARSTMPFPSTHARPPAAPARPSTMRACARVGTDGRATGQTSGRVAMMVAGARQLGQGLPGLPPEATRPVQATMLMLMLPEKNLVTAEVHGRRRHRRAYAGGRLQPTLVGGHQRKGMLERRPLQAWLQPLPLAPCQELLRRRRLGHPRGAHHLGGGRAARAPAARPVQCGWT